MQRERILAGRKTGFWGRLVRNRTLVFMCLPAILFFFVFSYMPMPGSYVAFTRFDYGKGIFTSEFVGFKNFEFLFRSGQLSLLLRNTVLYNLAFIILGNFLQLTFAIMLSEVGSKRFKKTAQSMMFLPYFISAVLVSLLVYNLINYDYGFISTSCGNSGRVMPVVLRLRGRLLSCWCISGSPPATARWFILPPLPPWMKAWWKLPGWTAPPAGSASAISRCPA